MSESALVVRAIATGLLTVLVTACVESGPRPGEAPPPACKASPPKALAGESLRATEKDRPEPGPYAWKNVVIKGGGFVTGIIASLAIPDLIYARTDVGGAYRWEEDGKRWKPLTDWLGRADGNLTGIESIATDPLEPNRVYLAAGTYLSAGHGWILASDDQGDSWSRHAIGARMGGNVNGRSMGERLAVDPNLNTTLYFASRDSGLWKSTDSAKSWKVVRDFPVTGAGNCDFGEDCGLSFVLPDPTSGSAGSETPVIYVGVGTTAGDALFRTTDAGASWEAVEGQPSGMMPHHAVLDPCDNIYLAYNDWAGPNDVGEGAIWRHNRERGDWEELSPPKRGGGFGGIAIDARDPQTLLVTTIALWAPDEIYRTTDGGQSWAALGSGAQRDPAGAEWLYWHSNSVSATGWMGDIEIDPFDSSRALYITGQGIWSSNNVNEDETNWRFDNDGLEETVPLDLASPPTGALLLSALGDISGFRHDDLDVSPPQGMFSNPIFGNSSSLDFAEAEPDIVARVGTSSSGGGARGAFSTDGGTTWTPFPASPSAAAGEGMVAVSADGETFLWAPRQGEAAYSRDRGKTWTPSTGLPERARVASDRVAPLKFYASAGSRVYVSRDGGATFTQACSGAASCPAGRGRPRPLFGSEGDVWLPSSSGLYHSQDSGKTWLAVPDISEAVAVGFGKAAPGQDYPAIYLSGAKDRQSGLYRSDDGGSTWARIDDDEHRFGYVNHVTGDQRTYGRIYIGTGGRGVLYGDPQELVAPSPGENENN